MQKQPNEKGINVTFTLAPDIVSWINRQTVSEDMNQSQLARKVFRKAMAEDAKTKLVKAPRKGKQNG